MLAKIKSDLQKYPRLFSITRKIYRRFKIVNYLYLKRDINYFKCYSSATSRLDKSLGKPILLTLEPTNTCNLRCPVCETGSGRLNREPKMMKIEEFKYILDKFDENLKILYLYYMGEPFLNKDIYKMIRYAADRGIYVSICTDGEFVDSEELVRSGLAEIQFQIGGVTQEVHGIYRKGGNLDRTLERLKSVIDIKRRSANILKNEKYITKVALGLILMKHNEHQVNNFVKLAKEIGVDEFQIIDPCVRNVEQGRFFLPSDTKRWFYDPVAFERGELRVRTPPNNYCEWIYSTVTVQVNGDVVPCCRDAQGDYVIGNIFNESLDNIWNNEKYRLFRKKILRSQKEVSLCRLCSGYSIPNLRY